PRAFGTILQPADLPRIDSDQNEGSFGIYGLGVFVRGLFSNLLRFSGLDEFHIFTTGFPGERHPEFGLASDPRVRLRPLTEFPSAIREDNFAILHNPWGPDIGPWVDLRNRLASRNIPVTGLTHTISFQSMLPRLLLTLLLDAKPWDSIVCTAEPAVAAMRNWLSHLRSHLSPRVNLDFDIRFDKVPLAVDVDSFRSGGDVGEHRRRLNLPENQVIALYFGRFSAYDKMDLAPLLLAFKKALEERSERTMLVMAGADSRFQYAAQVQSVASTLGISDSVRILRDIPAQDVARLYQAADIFVSPSDNLQETFGLTVVEAMASGLPVVCSDWDGYRDLVVDGETGFLIPTYCRPCDSSVADLATMWEPEPAHFYLGQTV
ncbi:MAG: glycosyltransferase family 4 protein, partial [Blastocatellia bacterium]